MIQNITMFMIMCEVSFQNEVIDDSIFSQHLSNRDDTMLYKQWNIVLNELHEEIERLKTRRIKTTERVNKAANRIFYHQIYSGVALLVFIILVLILCKMIIDIKQNREDVNVFDDMEEEDDEDGDEVDIIREIVISHKKMLQKSSNNSLSAPAA